MLLIQLDLKVIDLNIWGKSVESAVRKIPDTIVDEVRGYQIVKPQIENSTEPQIEVKNQEPSEENQPEIFGLCMTIICTTLLISIVAIAIALQRRRQVLKQKRGGDFEVERKNVMIESKLGEGNFGTVHKGTFKDYRQVGR